MEVSQFTYFQQVGGIECQPVPLELTMVWKGWRCLFKADNVYDPIGTASADEGGNVYGDIFKRAGLNFQIGILNTLTQICCCSIFRMQKLNVAAC